MSGPKETQVTWLLVLPITIPKSTLAAKLTSGSSTPTSTINLSSPGVPPLSFSFLYNPVISALYSLGFSWSGLFSLLNYLLPSIPKVGI